MVSCGGYAKQGKGPFDMEKLLGWLRQRDSKIMPVKAKHRDGSPDNRYNSPIHVKRGPSKYQQYTSVDLPRIKASKA